MKGLIFLAMAALLAGPATADSLDLLLPGTTHSTGTSQPFWMKSSIRLGSISPPRRAITPVLR